MNKYLKNVLVPILAVLLGLLFGALIMWFSGYDPILGYQSLWEGIFSTSYNIGESIRTATPLILAGLACAFTFRTGLFNIGVEGQFIVGWTAAVWVGITFKGLPLVIHLPFAIIVAGLAGAAWAFIPGVLKAKLHVHEVIVTIMMNYIALHVTNSIISQLAPDGNRTEKVAASASLAWKKFAEWTDFSRLHWGIAIALLAALIYWCILERSKSGFELRSVGFNRDASQYAGMSVSKNIILAMVISGTFAGVAGAMEGLGTFQDAVIKGGFTNVGFDGIAVALIGGNTAIGTVLAAFLFGGMKQGSLNMPLMSGVPTEVVSVVTALFIYFIAANYPIRKLLDKIGLKKGAK